MQPHELLCSPIKNIVLEILEESTKADLLPSKSTESLIVRVLHNEKPVESCQALAKPALFVPLIRRYYVYIASCSS